MQDLTQWVREPHSLQACLDLEVPGGPGAWADLVRRWMELASARIAEAHISALQAAPPLTTRSLGNHLGAFGEPGTPWGSLILEPDNRRRQSTLHAWTPQTWERFLGAGLDSNPRGFEARFSELDDWGQPGDGVYVELGAHRDAFLDGWASLRIYREPVDDALAPDELNALACRWVELVEIFVELAGVPIAFGCVCDDMRSSNVTTLEYAINIQRMSPLEDGRLRGYSWATLIGARPLEMLGGVDALISSGAFCRVKELPFGTVLAQATPRITDYDAAAVERVFRALAPALPAGLAKPAEFFPGMYSRAKLVFADAADVVGQDGSAL